MYRLYQEKGKYKFRVHSKPKITVFLREHIYLTGFLRVDI